MAKGKSARKHRDVLLASTTLVAALTGAIAMATVTLSSVAQNIRGSAAGPTTAPSYDHPGQYIHVQDVKPADNMYPVVQHPDQDRAAQAIDRLDVQYFLRAVDQTGFAR